MADSAGSPFNTRKPQPQRPTVPQRGYIRPFSHFTRPCTVHLPAPHAFSTSLSAVSVALCARHGDAHRLEIAPVRPALRHFSGPRALALHASAGASGSGRPPPPPRAAPVLILRPRAAGEPGKASPSPSTPRTHVIWTNGGPRGAATGATVGLSAAEATHSAAARHDRAAAGPVAAARAVRDRQGGRQRPRRPRDVQEERRRESRPGTQGTLCL